MIAFQTFAIAALATIGLSTPAPLTTQAQMNARYPIVPHIGDCTCYFLGLGACVLNHSGQDDSANVVAILAAIMGTGPTLANDPFCGRTVVLEANGKTVEAIVADKCPGCSDNDIDVSRKIFVELFG